MKIMTEDNESKVIPKVYRVVLASTSRPENTRHNSALQIIWERDQ